MSSFNSSKPFIISPVLFLIPCTFSVPIRIVFLCSLCLRNLYLSRVFLMGFLAIFLFLMSSGLACCTNPQLGGPGDFWSRFSSSSPSYTTIKLQGSSASFVPLRVIYFPCTRLIWWEFPYPPTGEAPNRRLAAPHGLKILKWLYSVAECCLNYRPLFSKTFIAN